MRTFGADEFDKALGHAIDAGWVVEDEVQTTPGGSQKRSLRLGAERAA